VPQLGRLRTRIRAMTCHWAAALELGPGSGLSGMCAFAPSSNAGSSSGNRAGLLVIAGSQRAGEAAT
jgi:hypothetical protein